MKFGKYQRAIFRPSSPDSTRITDKKKKKKKEKRKRKQKQPKIWILTIILGDKTEKVTLV